MFIFLDTGFIAGMGVAATEKLVTLMLFTYSLYCSKFFKAAFVNVVSKRIFSIIFLFEDNLRIRYILCTLLNEFVTS